MRFALVTCDDSLLLRCIASLLLFHHSGWFCFAIIAGLTSLVIFGYCCAVVFKSLECWLYFFVLELISCSNYCLALVLIWMQNFTDVTEIKHQNVSKMWSPVYIKFKEKVICWEAEMSPHSRDPGEAMQECLAAAPSVGWRSLKLIY